MRCKGSTYVQGLRTRQQPFQATHATFLKFLVQLLHRSREQLNRVKLLFHYPQHQGDMIHHPRQHPLPVNLLNPNKNRGLGPTLRQVCQSWLSKLKQQQLGVSKKKCPVKWGPNFCREESNNTKSIYTLW